MDLILLAGGECPKDIKDYTHIDQRASLKVGEKTMAQIVVEAFRPFVQKIIVVGGPPMEGVDIHLPEEKTFTQAAQVGLENSSAEYAFVSTCDLPFLKPEHIQLFLNQIEGKNAHFYLPLIEVTNSHILFQNFKRTTLKSREGRMTGGNIALVNVQSALKIIHKADYLYKERKNPLKYFLKSNISVCIRAILGQLFPSLISFKKHIEPAVSQFLDSPAEIVILSCPEIGTDIDNLEHYQILQKMNI